MGFSAWLGFDADQSRSSTAVAIAQACDGSLRPGFVPSGKPSLVVQAPDPRRSASFPDGAYLLTARRDGSGNRGCSRRVKVESSGGGTHLEATSRLNSDADELLSAAIAVTGNEMTLTFTRPGGTLVRQYSVVTGAPTELRLYDPSSQSLESFTPQ